MNTSIELPSGKILNITRFIALIPNNNNIDSDYQLILEGYPHPINLEPSDAQNLKIILQSKLDQNTPISAHKSTMNAAKDCQEWLYALLARGVYICSSQLCDYEIRRSLILISQNKPKSSSIQNLDELQEIISFLPGTSELLKEASTLWASARSQGIPTADNKSLDIDIIM